MKTKFKIQMALFLMASVGTGTQASADPVVPMPSLIPANSPPLVIMPIVQPPADQTNVNALIGTGTPVDATSPTGSYPTRTIPKYALPQDPILFNGPLGTTANLALRRYVIPFSAFGPIPHAFPDLYFKDSMSNNPDDGSKFISSGVPAADQAPPPSLTRSSDAPVSGDGADKARANQVPDISHFQNTMTRSLAVVKIGDPQIACDASGTAIGVPGPAPKLKDGDSCPMVQLPSSGGFGGDYLKGVTADPDNPNVLYGISQHYDEVSKQTTQYISRSTNGGKTWAVVSKVDTTNSQNQKVFSDGLESTNSLIATKGNPKNLIFTTKMGAFQITPPSADAKALKQPELKEGVFHREANDVKLSKDGKTMIVSYKNKIGETGSKDFGEVVQYTKGDHGEWAPTELPLFDKTHMVPPSNVNENPRSIQACPNGDSSEIYAGLGSYAYHYDRTVKKWIRINGMEDWDRTSNQITCDAKGGVVIATCGGVYRAQGNKVTQKFQSPQFLFNRSEGADQKEIDGGSLLRAYSVDENADGQIVIGTARGVYFSSDGNKWNSANQAISTQTDWKARGKFDTEEFTTTHVNPDGTMMVSGFRGTYVLNKDGSCATK